jgi:hypothetical protein
MIWILLLYVLPLVLSILGAYYIVKSDGGSIKDFLEPLPFLLIPLFNIFALIVGLYTMISVWIESDDKWQDFLNKKL